MSDKRRLSDVSDYAAFATRIVKAHGRRVAAADPAALADLVALRSAVDDATDGAVRALHSAGYSWTDIARELGVSRQAARQRWSTPTDVDDHA